MNIFTLFNNSHNGIRGTGNLSSKTTNADNFRTIIKENLEEPLGINTNYSKDGHLLNNLENIIVPQATEECQTEFINNLVKYNSPLKLKLILLDSSSIIYNSYNSIPHMIIPVVTNTNKWIGAFAWACTEFQNRTSKFIDVGAKNINHYNKRIQSIGGQELPKIVIIVNEMHDLPDGAEDKILQLLLKSNLVGIYINLFSKFSIKSLTLGLKKDLLKTYSASQLRQLFGSLDNSCNNAKISVPYDNMNGHQFEYFCANLLKQNKFLNVFVTQGSSDHGIDILAEKDGITYAIQCKCYQSDVGNSAIQEAYSGKGIYKKDIAVVMTNRYFTKQAIDDANALGVKLWDRIQIEKFLSFK